MFTTKITEWVGNWFWDTFNEFAITILDNLLYNLVGFLYKVYIMLGTMDIFGGTGTGKASAKAIELYQSFTSRIYAVMTIIMVFILSYQIILYIINPDKGYKESQKLITNLVKGIIIVTICPLLFHYMAIFQQHVLTDNVIWGIMMGDTVAGGEEGNSIAEAGNSMAGMVYLTMFHPNATIYSDFYDSEGKLQPYEDACASYFVYYGSDSENPSADDLTEEGYISSTTKSHALRWAIPATVLLPGLGWVAGLAGGVVDEYYMFKTSSTGADTLNSCQEYWIDLYNAGGGTAVDSEDKYLMENYDVDSVNSLGYRNVTSRLSADILLVDQIKEESTMEYFYLAPIVGGILVYMLIAYALDLAYRAFKLAFLELIAPLPVLLGVIPKNEKVYDTWKSNIIKTYLDVFVRTFTMAFMVYMLELVPNFISAIFEAYVDILQGDALLRAVFTIFLVLGLLKFAKELPDMVKDMFLKNSMLNNFDLSPKNSIKNTFEAAKKPVAAVGGAIGGAAAAARGSFINNKDKSMPQRLRGALGSGLLGMASGGIGGYKSGSMTTGISKGRSTPELFGRKLHSARDYLKQKDPIDALDVFLGGRARKLRSAFMGDDFDNVAMSGMVGAASVINSNGKAFKGMYESAGEAYKTEAMKMLKTQYGNSVYDGQNVYTGASRQEAIENAGNAKANQIYERAKSQGNSQNGYDYEGNHYADLESLKKGVYEGQAVSTYKKHLAESESGGIVYQGEHIGADSYDAVEKIIKEHAKQKEIETLANKIANDPVEFMKQFGLQNGGAATEVFSQLKPEQMKKITDSMTESLKDSGMCESFVEALRESGYNGDLGNLTGVMDAMTTANFSATLSSKSEAELAEITKGFAQFSHEYTETSLKVANSIRDLKQVAGGVKTSSDFSGVSGDVLGNAGSGAEKK